ncbi:MAG: transposase family protein [Bacteroidota bacterium]
MDFVGPLPKTSNGNEYILVAVDHFSRWPELIATKDTTAETVATHLIDTVIARHGCPKRILSDRGAQFTSSLVKRLSERLLIKKIETSAYHPQCYG